MKKIFKYKQWEFSITVHLNRLIEKTINGKVLHRVQIKDNGNFVQIMDVETKDLGKTINDFEKLAKRYVDMQYGGTSPEVELLTSLGFK